jgi:hypothetical protein
MVFQLLLGLAFQRLMVLVFERLEVMLFQLDDPAHNKRQ